MQFGAALGVSVSTAVYAGALVGGSALDAFRTALIVPVLGAVLAAVVTGSGPRRRQDVLRSTSTA
jgi:hypothetical protein